VTCRPEFHADRGARVKMAALRSHVSYAETHAANKVDSRMFYRNKEKLLCNKQDAGGIPH
jgi:hypothetical protein